MSRFWMKMMLISNWTTRLTSLTGIFVWESTGRAGRVVAVVVALRRRVVEILIGRTNAILFQAIELALDFYHGSKLIRIRMLVLRFVQAARKNGSNPSQFSVMLFCTRVFSERGIESCRFWPISKFPCPPITKYPKYHLLPVHHLPVIKSEKSHRGSIFRISESNRGVNHFTAWAKKSTVL